MLHNILSNGFIGIDDHEMSLEPSSKCRVEAIEALTVEEEHASTVTFCVIFLPQFYT
jgi:hypothetical protein